MTRFAGAVAGFVLLAAACGGGSDTADSEPADSVADIAVAESGDTSDSPPASTAGVPQALQFTAPLVGGGEIDAASLSDKPTAFWFWAPT